MQLYLQFHIFLKVHELVFLLKEFLFHAGRIKQFWLESLCALKIGRIRLNHKQKSCVLCHSTRQQNLYWTDNLETGKSVPRIETVCASSSFYAKKRGTLTIPKPAMQIQTL